MYKFLIYIQELNFIFDIFKFHLRNQKRWNYKV